MIENFVFYQIFFILRMFSAVVSEESFIGYNDSSEKMQILPYLQENSEDSYSCDNWDSVLNEGSKAAVTSFNENGNKIKNKHEEYSQNDVVGKNFGRQYFRDFPIDGAVTRVEKKFDVLKSKYPLSGYLKRKPGFRSWGGKRSSSQTDEYLENGSKEENKDEEIIPSEYQKSISLNAEKRTRFSSWGGKRDNLNGQDTNYGLNNSNDKNNYKNPSAGINKKGWSDTNFYDTVKNQIQLLKYRALYNQDLFKKFVPKRPKFQSWGGKRSFPPLEDVRGMFYFRYLPARVRFEKTLNTDEKRKFSDWDRYNEIYEVSPKRASRNFNSWGGKRSDDDYDNSPKRYPHYFNSWGGKRDAEKSNIFFMTSTPKEIIIPNEDGLQRKIRDPVHPNPSKNEVQPE